MILRSSNTGKETYTQMVTAADDLFRKQYVANTMEQASAERFCNYCHEYLSKDHDVMEKLKKVHLTDFSIVNRFDLGYADNSYLKKIPHRDSFEGTYERGSLQRLSILSEISRLIFRGAIVFPLVYDIYHQIIGIYGYWVNPKAGRSRDHFTLWNNEGVGIFNKQSLDACRDELIICHSPLDACQLIEAGYDNAVAILGNGETEEHYYRLFHYHASIQRVKLVCSDSVFDQTWQLHMKLALQSHNIPVEAFTNA